MKGKSGFGKKVRRDARSYFKTVAGIDRGCRKSIPHERGVDRGFEEAG